MEQNTSDEASCCSSANMFTVKVVIAWLTICLPGNIFSIICIYGAENSDITSSDETLQALQTLEPNFSETHFINLSQSSKQNYSNFIWNQKIIIRHLNLSTYLREHDKKIQALKLKSGRLGVGG